MATNEALLSALIDGDEDAIEAFGESDNCMVVDWRDGLAEILDALTPFLPSGYLTVQRDGEVIRSVQAGTRAAQQIALSPGIKQEELFVAINNLLAPDFELRQYTPVDGDGYSLYLAPSVWWKSLERAHPNAAAQYFLSVERLAAYWRKGYLARMLSKP